MFESSQRPREYLWAYSKLPKPPLKVLDIGCGRSNGESGIEDFAKFLCEQGYDVTGIDIKPISWRHENFTFRHESITNNSLPSETFDVVVSFQVWHHVGMGYQLGVPKECQERCANGHIIFLNEVHRVLKTNGVAIITTVIEPSLRRDDTRQFTRETAHNLVVQKGFEVLHEEAITTPNYTLFLLHLRKKESNHG